MHNIDRSATIILGLSWVYFVTRAFLRGQVQHVSFKQRHSAILEFHLEEVSNERWIVDSKGGIVWFKPMSFCSLHSTQRFLNVSRPGCWCVFYRFCGPTFYRFLTDFRRYHFGLFGSIWVYLGLFGSIWVYFDTGLTPTCSKWEISRAPWLQSSPAPISVCTTFYRRFIGVL